MNIAQTSIRGTELSETSKPILKTWTSYPLIIFVASLCLANLKFFDISLTIYCGLLVTLASIRTVLSPRARVHIEPFDAICFFYAIISYLHLGTGVDPIVLYKLLAYYAIFWGFRETLRNHSDPVPLLRVACVIGIICFGIVFIIGAVLANISIQDLLSFSYWRVTIRVYAAVFGELAGITDTESAMLMRNTIGQALAFYFGFLYLNKSKVFPWLALLGIFFMQSRRAFLAAAMMFLSGKQHLALKIAIVVIIFALYSYIVSFSAYAEFDSRLTNLEASARLDQYYVSWQMIRDNPIWGFGFGTKVLGAYVHNFFLSSWLMNGFAGLLFCVAFAAIIAFRSLRAKGYGVLFIIPGIDLMVASTVEGLMSLTSWAVVAVIFVLGQSLRPVTAAGGARVEPGVSPLVRKSGISTEGNRL